MKELFHEIWSSLKQNKLRTTLTGLAVAWGIFLLIVMLGAGNGLLNALIGNSSGLDDSMLANAGWTSKPYEGYEEGRRIWMDTQDLSRLVGPAFAQNVDEVCPMVSQSSIITYGDYYLSCDLIGVEGPYKKILKVDVLHGRFINARDNKEMTKVICLGKKNAQSLYGSEKGYEKLIGQYAKIGGFSYKIVGIFDSNEDNSMVNVFAPYTTVNTIYNKGKNIEQISFSVKGIESVEAAEELEDNFRKSVNIHHKAAPDDKRTLHIQNSYSSNKKVSKAINILHIAIWILGFMSLISGIVGVSNIMLITVKERTHEFGIRKAIGARPWSILSLIITESVAITTVFGYLGMFLGMVVTQIMDKTMSGDTVDLGITQLKMFDNPTVGLDVAIEATLFLIIAGTVAGLIPAYKASKVKPIEALRG